MNQQIRTHGGDVDQDIETHSTTASGDGAVAAGGDIRDSTVTTGDDNQVGIGNIRGDNNVQGDDNNSCTATATPRRSATATRPAPSSTTWT